MAAKLDDDTIGKIILLRLEGWTPTEIERTLKVSHHSVYKYLTEAGLHKVTKAGAHLKDECWRGHDLSEHSKPRNRGGRLCIKCKRINDRERRRKKYWEDQGMPWMYVRDESDTRRRSNGKEVQRVPGQEVAERRSPEVVRVPQEQEGQC